MTRRRSPWRVGAALVVLTGCAGAQVPPAQQPAQESSGGAPSPAVSGEFRPLTESPPAEPARPPTAGASSEALPIQDLSRWMKRADLLSPPASAPATGSLAPGLQALRLGNQLPVLIVPRPGARTVDVVLAVRAGVQDELPGQSGLAALTAGALRRGTSSHSPEQLDAAMYLAGADVETTAGPDVTTSSCRALASKLASCMELIARLNLAPTFPERGVSETRQRLQDEIRRRAGDPVALARAHFEDLTFGEQHPRGRLPTVEGIGNLRREAALTFWRRLYRPNNAVLVVVGDVTAAVVKSQAQQQFGGWKPASVPEPAVPTVSRRKGIRVLLVDQDARLQAQLMLGRVVQSDPVRTGVALELLTAILGGAQPRSRLQGRLVGQGVAAAADAELEPGRRGSVLRITALTSPELAWDALVAAADQLRGLRDQPPGSADAQGAAQALITRTAILLQDGGALAVGLARATLVEGGPEALAGRAAALASAHASGRLEPVRQELNPDDLVAVVVGPAVAIGPVLDRHALNYERVGASESISHVERSRRRLLLAGVSAPGERNRAQALLEAAVQAQGGARLRGLRELTVVKTGTQRSDGIIADLISTTHYRRPDRVRIEQEMVLPAGKSRTVFVIDAARVRGNGGEGPLGPVPAYNARRLRDAVFEDVAFLPLNLLEAKPARPMRVLPSWQAEGRSYDVVLAQLPGGEWNELHFDARTHLLARVRSQGAGGEPIEQRLEDWRDAGGVWVPFLVVSDGGGGRAEAKVREVKLEPRLPNSLFD